MAITAKDVQKLREMTGVGMMDCKKALTEAEGDFDKAVEILREKGLAASAKKAGRIAAEGMAYAAVVDGMGVVVEVNAETDFVAKNEKFVDFVKGVAATVAECKPADLDALMACKFAGGELTVLEQQRRWFWLSARTSRFAALPCLPRALPFPTSTPAARSAFWSTWRLRALTLPRSVRTLQCRSQL